ncbi:MAG TPA: histidine phosphatase family protein [Tepidisphaeraceae bacterium]|nr:histidine phosphatase family protein [Tepidisphaeraceae bacterium]
MSKHPRRPSHGLAAIAILLLLLASQLRAKDQQTYDGPKAIYILRHGEKPDGEKDPNLSPQGYERARSLAKVIPEHFCTPDFIFATAPSKHSARPLETIEPLAQSLHMSVIDPYPDADFGKLAHALLTEPQYRGKTIVICWHHEEIPSLARALGAESAPRKWKSDVFDRMWVLTYSHGQVVFQDLPQKALPGDSGQ